MSWLDRLLHFLGLRKKREDTEATRVFLQDQELISMIRDVAMRQERPEAEVIADLAKAGLSQFMSQSELEQRWSSLSSREQQVVALICLGYRNYEIAQTLVIAPETVKSHLKRIFNKFNLRSTKELRLALKDWDFSEWGTEKRHR